MRFGGIETNPSSKYLTLTYFSCNLNGLKDDHSTKTSLLQAYITQHNYDICLCETFVNSSIRSDDIRLNINGYNLMKIRPFK